VFPLESADEDRPTLYQYTYKEDGKVPVFYIKLSLVSLLKNLSLIGIY
jgi:hypothetical protein